MEHADLKLSEREVYSLVAEHLQNLNRELQESHHKFQETLDYLRNTRRDYQGDSI